MTEDTSERAERIVRAAAAVLAASGELKMKEVASQAGVSLAALYEHFPSKDLLVLRVGVAHMRRGLDVLTSGPPAPGSTPGERLAIFLLRYFRAAQREPSVARALAVLDPLGAPGPSMDAITQSRAEIADLIQQMAVTAALGGGPELGGHAESMITYALSMLHLGCISWLSGDVSAAEVRRSVAFGALLIDIPGDSANSLLSRAGELSTTIL